MTDETIFAVALEQASAAERAEFVAGACDGPEQRARVESLLAAHDRAGAFLGRPAVAADSDDATHTAAPDEVLTRTTDPAGGDADDADVTSFLAPPGRPDSLGRIGHYEVLEVLGRGGFGIVFRAFDTILQRVVAVKVLAPHMAATSPARKRFLREARSAAVVQHEYVVRIHETGETPLPYLVMEFVPGETLQQHMDRTGPLEVAEAVKFARQIAAGLAAAHDKGLIHRDIKPSNVLIDAGGQQAKITDFGLARAADDASLTRSGVVAGTPMYMAPEQARGEALDQRADLFSLGSVLYAMLTGRPPFRAANTPAVLKRVAEDDPRPIREIIPEVPEWACRIVGTLHAKNPADRFQTAREVADLLADCEQQLKAHGAVKDFTRIPGGKPMPARRWSRRRVRVAGGLLAFVSLLYIALWVGPFAYRYMTDRGTLEILPADGLVSVIVLQNDEGDLVTDKLHPPVTDWLGMKEGSHSLTLPPGKYQLNVGTYPAGTEVSQWEVTTADLFGRRTVVVPVIRTSAVIPVGRGERVTVRPKMVTGTRPPDPSPHPDTAKLHGRWTALSATTAGFALPPEALKSFELSFTGDRVRLAFDMPGQFGGAEEGTFTFPSGKSGEIDFAMKKYTEPYRALYRLDGDRLTVCLGDAGNPRPDWFDAGPGQTVYRMLVELRRDTTADGFVPLFNGKDLSGWKTHKDQPGNWKVENGVLVGRGGATASHLFSERGDYADFHLRAEVKVHASGNSGVYFRAPFAINDKGHPDGYEAQLLGGDTARFNEPNKTGSLYGIKPFPDVVAPTDTWFTLQVVARGDRITVTVNDTTTADVRDGRYTRGHLALQLLWPETVVEFRKIEVKELPASAPAVPKTAAEVLPYLAGNWMVEMVQLLPKLPPGTVSAAGPLTFDYVAAGSLLRARSAAVEGLGDIRFLFSFDPDKNLLRQWQAWFNGNAHGPFIGLFNPDNRTLQWRHKLGNGIESFNQFDFVDANTIKTRLFHQDSNNTIVREMSMTFTRIQGPVAVSTRPLDPNRPAEMAVLDRLAGEWSGEATVAQPADKTSPKGRVRAVPVLGGRFIEQVVTYAGPGESDYSLVWYDPAASRYRQWVFRSPGFVLDLTGTWDEAAKTMSWVSSDERLEGRTVFKGDDLQEFQQFARDGDGRMRLTREGVNRRVAVKPAPPAVPTKAADLLPFVRGTWARDGEIVEPKAEAKRVGGQVAFDTVAGGKVWRGLNVDEHAVPTSLVLHKYDPATDKLSSWYFGPDGTTSKSDAGEYNPINHTFMWLETLPDGGQSVHNMTVADGNTVQAMHHDTDATSKFVFKARGTFTRSTLPPVVPKENTDPKRPAEMAVLDRLVGGWKTDITVRSTVESWRTTARLTLGGRFVEMTGTKDGGGASDYAVAWYDPAAKRYRQWYFNSDGHTFPMTGTWDAAANTLTWETADKTKSGRWVFKGDGWEFRRAITDGKGKVLSEAAGVARRVAADNK